MASGSSNTLTKELRIELKLVTASFSEQTKVASRALDSLNGKFKDVQKNARITGSSITGVVKEAKKLGSREVSSAVNQNSKALRSVSASAKSATKDLNKYSKSVTKASSRSLTASKNSKSFSTNLGRVDKSAKSATSSVFSFGNAIGAYAGIRVAKVAFDNALAFDRISNRLKAATVSTAEFNEKQATATRLANQLGVDLLASSRGYATLLAATRGSGVEGAVTDQLFESILKTSAALSLTADETNSVILAFGQVASKGRAAAEEIRGQIGERIPGFYVKLAGALGKTTAELTKLLDNGLLSSDEALKASAVALEQAFGQKALDNANSITAEYNRLSNTIRELAKFSTDFALQWSGLPLAIAKVNEQITAISENRAIEQDGIVSNIEFIANSAKNANEEFKNQNITLTQRNKILAKAEALIREQTKDQIGRFGGVDVAIAEQEALTQLALLRETDLETIRKIEAKAIELRKIERDRLEISRKIREEREKERKAFAEQVQFELNLKRANKLREEYQLYLKLKKAQDEALSNYKASQKDDPNSEDNLKKRLDALKKQKKILEDTQKLTPQQANEVSFISGASQGITDNDNVRKNILAKTRELGATRGDKDVALKQLQTLERMETSIEQLNDQIRELQEDSI